MPPSSENPRPKPEDQNQDADSEHKKIEDENQDTDIPLTRQVTQVSYSGPIPPAEEFARYEEVHPGSADRLFSMAEREQEEIVSFRKNSLVVATIVAIVTIVAIAYILTANPNALILVALAVAHVLPSITDFIRGMVDSALTRKERELEIQIRKDNHDLDMLAARQKLQLPATSDESVTQRARRLESNSESADLHQGNA